MDGSDPTPLPGSAGRAALLAALFAVGLAAGAAGGLLAPAQRAEPAAPSFAPAETGAWDASSSPPRGPARAFPPLGREGGEQRPDAQRVVSATSHVAARPAPPADPPAASRSPSAAALALIDAPLGASLAALLAATVPHAPSAVTETGTISGRIRTREGAPLAGVRVAAFPQADGLGLATAFAAYTSSDLARPVRLRDLACAVYSLRRARAGLRSALSGADGTFEVGGLSPGPHDLSCSADGWSLGSGSRGSVAPGARVDRVAIPARRVVVRVVDRRERAAPGASACSDESDLGQRADGLGVAVLVVTCGRRTLGATFETEVSWMYGSAEIDVALEGPTPTTTIRVGEPEAGARGEAPIFGDVLGAPESAAGLLARIDVCAVRLAPGVLATAVPEERWESGATRADRSGDRYCFPWILPGTYAVATRLASGALGAVHIVEVDGTPRRVDVEAPDAAAAAGSRLRVTVLDALGAPLGGASVEVGRCTSSAEGDFECIAEEHIDDDGRAALEIPPEAALRPSPGGGLPAPLRLLVRSGSSAEHLAPEALGGATEVLVRVPAPAALVVTAPPEVLAALGRVRSLALVRRGAAPPDRVPQEPVSGAIDEAGLAILGPIASGSYDLWTYASPRGDGDVRPLGAVPVDLAPGITELTLSPPATRAVTLLAPGEGWIEILALDPATGAVDDQPHSVGPSGRRPLPRLPDRALVAAFVPRGARTVAAFALLPAGLSGEVALSAEAARGMAVLVVHEARAGPRSEDEALALLRGGDLIIAVEGAPIEDALRPFGDRLAPESGDAPIRLSVHRRGRAVDLEVTPARLRAEIGAGSPFLAPHPAR